MTDEPRPFPADEPQPPRDYEPPSAEDVSADEPATSGSGPAVT
jgi:hypothetical protein